MSCKVCLRGRAWAWAWAWATLTIYLIAREGTEKPGPVGLDASGSIRPGSQCNCSSARWIINEKAFVAHLEMRDRLGMSIKKPRGFIRLLQVLFQPGLPSRSQVRKLSEHPYLLGTLARWQQTMALHLFSLFGEADMLFFLRTYLRFSSRAWLFAMTSQIANALLLLFAYLQESLSSQREKGSFYFILAAVLFFPAALKLWNSVALEWGPAVPGGKGHPGTLAWLGNPYLSLKDFPVTEVVHGPSCRFQTHCLVLIGAHSSRSSLKTLARPFPA